MEIVDAQVHLWTNDKAPRHHRQTPLRMEDALREMDAAGVARAINCPAIWDPGANAYAVEAAGRHPDRFATLGWFDLGRDPKEGFIDRFVAQPGMLGLRFVLVSSDQQAAFSSGGLDWIWEAADRLALPVGLMLPPGLYGVLEDVARRYPSMRLLIDHMGVGPFAKVPQALAHLDALVALAVHPNIAVKTTGAPAMAADAYPFASIHDALHRVFTAFGAHRTFWGADITRLSCSWRDCITLFTRELPWLAGEDLDLVMGRALRAWVGWR